MTIGKESEPTEEFLAEAAITMEELQKTDGAGVMSLDELNERRRVRDGVS